MSTQPEETEDEVYFTENEDNTPVTCATQALDLLALNLPPEKLIPHLVQFQALLLAFSAWNYSTTLFFHFCSYNTSNLVFREQMYMRKKHRILQWLY